ncbi:hypothetical protein ONZ51_g7978 [Trametes cubensis]|uniref:Uncharacterized protein n=1 Tax=Trametes cubensis TaxID=1111947 RepID=A0AAD7TR71_9APHY|nr:hypothetical protein ONZ51_g7978 [Trametes cubensis]
MAADAYNVEALQAVHKAVEGYTNRVFIESSYERHTLKVDFKVNGKTLKIAVEKSGLTRTDAEHLGYTITIPRSSNRNYVYTIWVSNPCASNVEVNRQALLTGIRNIISDANVSKVNFNVQAPDVARALGIE